MKRVTTKFASILLRRLTTTGVVIGACVAGGSANSTFASDTLKEFITDTVPADFYWPLENSYISDRQVGTDRERAKGHEKNGIFENDCDTGGSSSGIYDPAEYFPILADHITRVGASSALIFGETTGDLDIVDRYLEFDFETKMLSTFGMHAKKEWTIHMVVSPADLDTGRGWETLFCVGDPDYMTGMSSTPVLITVDLKRETSQTRFRVRTESGGLAERVAEFTIADTKVEAVNGRLWYQVIAQLYDPDADPNHVRLYVNTVEDSSPPTTWSDNDYALANDYRSDIDSDARIGLDLEGNNPFHGAIHHLAIWKELIDTDWDVYTKLDALADAFEHSATLSESDTQSPLAVDWDADPRFFMWDVPLSDASLGGSRDLRNWNDPFWDIEGVYPIINHFTSKPNASNSSHTPPDITDSTATLHSWSGQPGETAEDVARQVSNWIEYVEIGLDTYTTSKSLSDTDACALNWQRWGVRPSSSCYYEDDRASRSLMNNWRDTPSIWRNASSHPYLDSSGYWDDELNEVETPYSREGMSNNAFRSKDLFIELADQIQTRNLPMPDRFHFDLEERSNSNYMWAVASGPTYYEGWWDESIADPRADDVEFWAPPTVSSGSYATLDDIDTAFPTATNYDRYASENYDITAALVRFFRDQFDHAFGVSLVQPAIQELNSGIRTSNYSMIHAGSTTAETFYSFGTSKHITNTEPVWFDFSAPVFYYPSHKHLTQYSASTDETLFQEWGTLLGINDLLITDDMDKNGRDVADEDDVIHDERIFYVERAKHNINAIYLASGGWDGAPMSPWLEYPGTDGRVISSRFSVGTIDIPIEQDDLARIAVFAYRHGVREFLFWGNYADIIDQEDTLDGLEYIFDAVEAVKVHPSDMSTINSVAGDPGYGVPDGVISTDDIVYYYNKYYNRPSDLEADYSGPDGYPDGVVDSYDVDDYVDDYVNDQN